MIDFKGKIICGDSGKVLQEFPDECIDIVLTGPPYDRIKMKKEDPLDLHLVGENLYRVLKIGGVCVLVIQDTFKDGAKSLTSFRTVIDWVENVGFRLWADYVYWRQGSLGGYWWDRRPRQDHDYIFVFVKGKRPTYFNKAHMKNHRNVCKGTVLDYRKDFRRIKRWWGKLPIKKYLSDPFPVQLVNDFILSYSDKGMIVLDPFCGSGLVLKIARNLDRKYVGIELSQSIVDYALDKVINDNGFGIDKKE